MKQLYSTLFIFLAFVSSSLAQCVSASWLKSFGGSTAYESFFDGGKRNDGKFVVAGSMGAGTVNLVGTSVSSTAFYSIFLAIHDSAGIFESSNVIGKYSSGDQLSITKVQVAADNSIFICGHYRGSSVQLSNFTLPAVTRLTVFVARFSPSLQFMWWTRATQTGADQYANDLALDANKNIYITGSFEDDAFMFQDSVIDNQGGYMVWSDDAYLLKLDSLGYIKFLVNIGAPSNSDESGRTVTADSSGNVLVSGVTGASNVWLTVSPQIGLFVPSGPNQSMFLAKYSGATGKCKWAKLVGGYYPSEQIYPYETVAGENNSVYMCGTITGTIQFSPKSYVSNDQNGFIAKIDSAGNSVWLDVIGGTNSSEYATSINYSNGRIAVSGSLFSNNGYMGKFPLYSLVASPVAYSGLYQSDGSLIFARANASSPSNNISNRVSLIDDAGNLMVWGSFKATQNWYPLSATNSLSNYKSFLVKYKSYAATPAFTLTAGPDKTTTCGVSVQLSGAITPTSGVTFGWYPDLPFPGNSSKTPTVNPGSNTSYTFFGTYQGCMLRDTVNVTYTNNALTVNAGSDLTVCSGDSMQVLTNVSPTGATFSWTPAKYINTATSQQPWVKPPMTTNYVVTATLNGCKAYDTVQIKSNPKPYIYLPKQNYYSPNWITHLCAGSTLDIDMGDPFNTYNILTPSLVSNVNNNLATILGNTGGYLKVIATTPAGCSRRDSVLVNIHQNQAGPPIYGTVPNRSACPGDSTSFNLVLHNSIQYQYQYGWYGVWQVDSLDGNGWQDINYWDPGYETFNSSAGFSVSTYYSTLRVWNVSAGSNGYKYRLTLKDYCSPRSYSNVGILTVGPKITAQPLTRNFCQNVTDSIFTNSSSAGSIYEWEIKQGGVYVPLVNQPGVLVANGRYLRIVNAQPSLDGTVVRCKLTGCSPTSYSYTDSAIIKVISIPVITSQAVGDTICAGVNDSLFVNVAGGPYTYQWYANGSPITYNTSQLQGYNTRKLTFTPVYSFNSNVVYTCKISNATCNFNVLSDTAVFVVKPQPTATVTPATQNICATGGSGTISVSGGVSYSWSPSSGLNTTTGNQVIASPTSATTYSVTATGTNGCSIQQTSIVNLTSTITATMTASANAVCQGSSITLTASGGNSYSWSPPIGLSSTTGPVVTASPMSNMVYTVTATNGTCTATATKSITSYPTPSITVSQSTTSICAGSSATLSASGSPYYSWSPAGSLSSSTTASVTATPTTTTTYTVTGSNYQGCYDIEYLTLAVNTVPTITVATTTDTLCFGSSTTINANGATTYSWSPSTGLSSTTGSTVTASPTSTQTYTVTGSNGNCFASSSTIIRVVPSPGFTIGGSPSQICEGSSTTLTATNSTHTYEWFPPTGLSSTTGVSVTASPNTTTSYTVTGTNTYGCTAVRNYVLTVNPIPVVTVTAIDDTICSGTTTILTAYGATSYSWTPGTGLNTMSGNQVYSSSTTTVTYTITGTSANCSDDTTMILTVLQSPNVVWTSGVPDTVCTTGNVLTLQAGSPAGGIYSGPGVVNDTFDPSIAGQGLHGLTYTYTDPATNCNASVTEYVYVDICAGMRSMNQPEIIVLQKNNSIEFRQENYFEARFTARIYSVSGDLLTERFYNNTPSGSIKIDEFAEGIYYVVLADEVKQKVVKIAIFR